MIVIISEINGYSDVNIEDPEFKISTIKQVIKVSTLKKLLEVLENNKDEKILLFTNFPPDSSYPESGKSMNLVDKGSFIQRSWDADSYSTSTDFFIEICKKYSFKAIHFITGAPGNMVTDTFLESFADFPITVKRNKDFIEPGLDYSIAYKCYLIKKISELN